MEAIPAQAPKALERDTEDAVDLFGTGVRIAASRDHLGDVCDVGVGADYAGLLTRVKRR